MTEKQIKKLEEKKEKIDNEICNLRALRQESIRNLGILLLLEKINISV